MRKATREKRKSEALFRLDFRSGFHYGIGLAIQQVLGQQADGPAAGALLLAGGPGGAGDVQVGPGEGVGEAREEAGGGDGARRAAADVGQVGEVGVELLLVLVPQRQVPVRVAMSTTLAGVKRSE